MREAFLAAERALNKFGRHWLEAGTCLGAIRQNDFLHARDDIDFGVYAEDVKDEKVLINLFEQEGFKEYRRFGTLDKGFELAFHYNETKVDVFLFYKKDNKRWHGAYYAKKLYPHVFDADLVENLREIEFCGVKCNVPADTERYLIARYGEDWRTPVKYWEYWRDPKCIDLNFI